MGTIRKVSCRNHNPQKLSMRGVLCLSQNIKENRVVGFPILDQTGRYGVEIVCLVTSIPPLIPSGSKTLTVWSVGLMQYNDMMERVCLKPSVSRASQKGNLTELVNAQLLNHQAVASSTTTIKLSLSIFER